MVNSYETATADFIHDQEYTFPSESLRQSIIAEAKTGATSFFNATGIARDLIGDTIASNLFLLGAAYQKGLVPVSAAAIEKAIELNGVSIKLNQAAFLWGRRAAVNLEAVESQIGQPTPWVDGAETLDQAVERHYAFLTEYQNQAWADCYLDLVKRAQQAEPKIDLGKNDYKGKKTLTMAVADSAFKLMSYKDEYEVARLYANGEFKTLLDRLFEPGYRIQFHLAPPILAKTDGFSGRPIKRRLPQFTMRIFKLLAGLKGLRGTAFDLFGRQKERRQERQLIKDYFALVDTLLGNLKHENYNQAIEIAALPMMIKGFGYIKEQNIERYQQQLDVMVNRYKEPALKVVVNS